MAFITEVNTSPLLIRSPTSNPLAHSSGLCWWRVLILPNQVRSPGAFSLQSTLPTPPVLPALLVRGCPSSPHDWSIRGQGTVLFTTVDTVAQQQAQRGRWSSDSWTHLLCSHSSPRGNQTKASKNKYLTHANTQSSLNSQSHQNLDLAPDFSSIYCNPIEACKELPTPGKPLYFAGHSAQRGGPRQASLVILSVEAPELARTPDALASLCCLIIPEKNPSRLCWNLLF